MVQIATRSGLVNMGTLAIDGTKIEANASKHKAMSYVRMKEEEKRLRGEIRRITKLARGIDEAEDAEFGPDFRGDELPKELRRRKDRLQVIRKAKQRLEAEQAAEDEAQGRGKHREETGRGPKLKRPNGVPEDKKQANFTDPDSRIMGDRKKGFQQGYKRTDRSRWREPDRGGSGCHCVRCGQRTVGANDEGSGSEHRDGCEASACGRRLQVRGELPGNGRDGSRGARCPRPRGNDNQRRPQRSDQLQHACNGAEKTKKSRAIYKRRKCIVEPPFGWIKSVMGFRSFSMRGLEKVTAEWSLVCLTLNLKRMASRLEWTT